jgi:hypothetical protein
VQGGERSKLSSINGSLSDNEHVNITRCGDEVTKGERATEVHTDEIVAEAALNAKEGGVEEHHHIAW